MFRRPLRRALALSLGAVLLVAGTASADSVTADSVTAVVDRAHFLGDVAPGGTVSADVHFVVTCIGLQHIDPGQAVVLTGNGGTEPLDGRIVSVTTATLDALDISKTPWATDGQGCPDPVPSYAGGAESHVVLRAPTETGTHKFTVAYSRSVSPSVDNELSPFSRTPTTIDFSMRVVANTPPVLSIGSVPTSPVQGDVTGGWTGTWTVSATDAQDDPDPTPTCSSAVGAVLPVGTTTVTCTVQDKAGATDTESFDVTVVDTTPPNLGAMPGVSVATDDPGGRTVEFSTPGATDVVDPSPSVTCSPASGDHFDVGPTPVSCTATDRYGNSWSGTFTVTVTYDPPPPPPPTHTASAVWLEPLAGAGSTFVANRGRTIPVKVRLFVDDRERTSGDAALRVTACGRTTGVELPLTWNGGRWNVSLDTGGYQASCYTIEAWVGDLEAGSFTLELRGDAAAKTAVKRTAVPPPSAAPTVKSKPTKSR